MADVIITSAGLDAVINQSLPKFSIKYFLPIYDQRIDPEIHTALSAGLATDVIPLLNAASSADTHETLIGEKLWNFENIGFTSAYDLNDSEYFVYEESGTSVNLVTGLVQTTSQSDTAPINILVDNADPLIIHPLSNMVSGTNIPEAKYNNVPGDFFYNSPVEIISSASEVSQIADRDLLWGGVVYAPANPTPDNQIATFQATVGIKNGSLKFNKGAFYIQKLLSDGTTDNTYNPVLFGEVLFNKTQYVRTDGNGSGSVDITLALDFIIDPGNELFIATDDWVKTPPVSGAQNGLFYHGDVAIGTSGFSGSWEPRAGLEITKENEPQLKLTKDYTSKSATFEVLDSGALHIETSGSAPNLSFGFGTSASGNASIAMGYETSADDFASFATGYNTAALSVHDTAMGYVTLAYGSNSFAICDRTIAEGGNSVAMGSLAVAAGLTSFCHGSNVFTSAPRSAIIGASSSIISATGSGSSILGGQNHSIDNNFSVIASGARCNIISGGQYGSIFGSWSSSISAESEYSSIISGQLNTIENNSLRSTIINGRNNTINFNCTDATIIGGQDHIIDNGVEGSSIIGGFNNLISQDAENSSILGGENNFNYGFNSSVVGGKQNLISTDALFSSVIGGQHNAIKSTNNNSQIIGGQYNTIEDGASGQNIIISGKLNTIKDYPTGGLNSNYGFISSSVYASSFGYSNSMINASYSVVYGHSNNVIGPYNTIGTDAGADSISRFSNVIGEGNSVSASNNLAIVGSYTDFKDISNSTIIGDNNWGWWQKDVAGIPPSFTYDKSHMFGDHNSVYGNTVSAPDNKSYIFGEDNFQYGSNGMLLGFGLHPGTLGFDEGSGNWTSPSKSHAASHYFDAITIGCEQINATVSPSVNYLNLYMPQGYIDQYAGNDITIRAENNVNITSDSGDIVLTPNNNVSIDGDLNVTGSITTGGGIQTVHRQFITQNTGTRDLNFAIGVPLWDDINIISFDCMLGSESDDISAADLRWIPGGFTGGGPAPQVAGYKFFNWTAHKNGSGFPEIKIQDRGPDVNKADTPYLISMTYVLI
jgi:hypothetical protein